MTRRLTPIDIEHAEFTVRVRGFDKVEVSEFLSRVALEVAEVLKERQGLERRLAEALEQVTLLQAEAIELEEAVRAAERSGADLKERAEREAQLLLAEAETLRRRRLQEIDASAQRERFELSRLKHQRALFMEQFRGLLEAYSRSLEGLEQSQPEAAAGAGSVIQDAAASTTSATGTGGKPDEQASERTDRALLDDSVGSER